VWSKHISGHHTQQTNPTNIKEPLLLAFFIEVLVGGLLSGVMYSLVALGFVLIYKASGVFNFAQGSMVLFAALTYAGLVEYGAPAWVAFLSTFLVMVGLAHGVERFVLRPLVNRSQLTLFMATLGLSFILEGMAQFIWGAQVRSLDLAVSDVPLDIQGVLLSKLDMAVALVAASLVLALSLLFTRTRLGLAVRAVADDSFAAQSVGISLPQVWAVVWSTAGFVGIVAGLVWGARSGVQFSLSLIVLKALPVLIIGGFGSIPGAIVAGLVVGAAEKLMEVYVGSLVNGGTETWFAYVLALTFLLFRPTGLWGGAQVERV
jgi:branched-chain amino acid transport system permease protein